MLSKTTNSRNVATASPGARTTLWSPGRASAPGPRRVGEKERLALGTDVRLAVERRQACARSRRRAAAGDAADQRVADVLGVGHAAGVEPLVQLAERLALARVAAVDRRVRVALARVLGVVETAADEPVLREDRVETGEADVVHVLTAAACPAVQVVAVAISPTAASRPSPPASSLAAATNASGIPSHAVLGESPSSALMASAALVPCLLGAVRDAVRRDHVKLVVVAAERLGVGVEQLLEALCRSPVGEVGRVARQRAAARAPRPAGAAPTAPTPPGTGRTCRAVGAAASGFAQHQNLRPRFGPSFFTDRWTDRAPAAAERPGVREQRRAAVILPLELVVALTGKSTLCWGVRTRGPTRGAVAGGRSGRCSFWLTFDKSCVL